MFFKMQSKLTGYDWDVRECGKKVSLYMGILFFQLFSMLETFKNKMSKGKIPIISELYKEMNHVTWLQLHHELVMKSSF